MKEKKDKQRIWDTKFPDMYKRKASGVYYLRYWSPKLGRMLEVSLETDVLVTAQKARKRLLENLDKQKSADALSFKTWRSVAEAFKDSTTWKSDATKKAALNQIDNHLMSYFGGYDPEAVDDDLWQKYASMRRSKKPNVSLHNARKYLWKVQNWAHSKGIVKKTFIPFDFDAQRKSPGVIVTQKQLRSIQKHLPQDWVDLSELAFQMAFRIGELKNLTWDRVLFNSDEIVLNPEHTKTRRGRKPVMTSKAFEILKIRQANRLSDVWVFPMPSDPTRPMHNKDEPWQKAKKKANIKCRFHDLRHTWLTNAFKKSNRYAEICEYAGLSLDEALDTYVKFDRSDMQAIAKAVSTSLLGKTGETQRNE